MAKGRKATKDNRCIASKMKGRHFGSRGAANSAFRKAVQACT